jgi:cell division protein FtsL
MFPRLLQRPRSAYRLAMVASIVVLAAAEVWLAYARYEVSGQTERGLDERQTLTADLNRLNLELASITRPDRLRSEAKKLGMAPPSPMQVVRP